MIAHYRRILGRALLAGGFALISYQILIWYRVGLWERFSLSVVVEGSAYFLGLLIWYFPFSSSEGVDMIMTFQTSQLPSVVYRFFETIPLSGFMMVLGYFLVKWEKYLG